MIVDILKFKPALQKCIGIVNVQGNTDTLKTFYIKPDIEDSKLYLAGSDGNINFLDKIDCEFEQSDSEEVIILPVDKLYPIVRYSEDKLQIKKSDTSVTLISGKRQWTIADKVSEDDYVDVPFSCYDISEFEDIFDSEKFRFILERLASNLNNPGVVEPEFKQLYMVGDKAYTSSASFCTIASMKSNEKYVFKDRVVKAIIGILRGYTGEVKVTYSEDELSCIVRTPTNVLVFKNTFDGELDEIDAIESVELENAVAVPKLELLNIVNCAKISSSGKLSVSIDPDSKPNEKGKIQGSVIVESSNSIGESFKGETRFLSSNRTSEDGDTKVEGTQFEISVDDFLTSINIIKTDFVVIRYSSVTEDYLSIVDAKKTYRSILAIA